MAVLTSPDRVRPVAVRYAAPGDEPALRRINRAAGVEPHEHRRGLLTWACYTSVAEAGGVPVGYIADRFRREDDTKVILRLVARPFAVGAERALLAEVMEPRHRLTTRHRFRRWKARTRFAVPVAREHRTADVLALCRTSAPAWLLADAMQEAGEPRRWLLRALRHGDELADRLARAVAAGVATD